MIPVFILEETTVRESGEGPVLECAEIGDRPMIVTLGITHAVERQSLELEIYESEDGQTWSSTPILTFPAKYYCGTYEGRLGNPARFLKAAWKVNRWGGGDRRPYFRFYVFGEPVAARVMAGAA